MKLVTLTARGHSAPFARSRPDAGPGPARAGRPELALQRGSQAGAGPPLACSDRACSDSYFSIMTSRPGPGAARRAQCLHQVHRFGDGHLAERPEARADLCGKQLRLFPRGEVATSAGLVEVAKVGVDRLGPAARGLEDLAGNTVKATGSETSGTGCPAAAAAPRALSECIRAAEVAVPVSQYSVMLSRMWSRVRPPEGCP
jgi:hypothetical protein